MTDALLWKKSEGRLRLQIVKASWMGTEMLQGQREWTGVLPVLIIFVLLIMCWNHSVVNGQLPQVPLPSFELPSLQIPPIGLPSLSLPSIGLPPISFPLIPNIPGISEIFRPPTTNPSLCYWEDSMALLSFRAQLSDPRDALSSWNPLTDCCGWRGVTCFSRLSADRRVIGLQLSIQGHESDSSFLSVTSTFSATAGVPLSSLSALETLSLTSVAFNTDLPLAWGNLSNLSSLTLVNCGFTGGIPPIYATLQNLRHLHLSNNKLRGGLPLYITEIFRRLQTLDLSSNNFTGSIVLLFRSNLTSLDLAKNEFDDDPIPDLFGFLSQLRHLDLSHNRFRGSIPQSLQTLRELRFLDLSSNQLEGSIPPVLLALDRLTSVFLQGNGLSGNIPVVFAFGSQIQELDLSNNSLTGVIPPTISLLGRLQSLDLSNNKLTALIPDTLVLNSELEFLYLESNGLLGLIPPELATLHNLVLANVSHNFLFGPVPGGPWPSFPASAFDANLGLCGSPLQKCPLTFSKSRSP